MGCYSSADGRVDKMRLQTPEDGPDPNAPRLVKLRVCAVPQGITMDNIGNRRWPRVMATIDGRGIVPSDVDNVGPWNPALKPSCYRFASGPLSAPGWQFRLDFIVSQGSPGSMSLIPGVHSLLTVNPSDCCNNPLQLYGCTDPQSLDDETCTYSPRPNPTSDEGLMARKGRGLSDVRMNRYKQFNG